MNPDHISDIYGERGARSHYGSKKRDIVFFLEYTKGENGFCVFVLSRRYFFYTMRYSTAH